MARINRSHKKRDIKDHIVAENKAHEAGVGEWDAKQLEVHSDIDLAVDTGWGKAVILRQFDYAFPPGIQQIPTKEQILTPGYLKFLETQLYFVDELELVMPPKVVIGQKGFKIFATCQARKGSLVHQKPTTLKEIAHDHNARANPD